MSIKHLYNLVCVKNTICVAFVVLRVIKVQKINLGGHMKALILGIVFLSALNSFAKETCKLQVGFDTTHNLDYKMTTDKIAKILRWKGYQVQFLSDNSISDFSGEPDFILESKTWQQAVISEMSPKSSGVTSGAVVNVKDLDENVIGEGKSNFKYKGYGSAVVQFFDVKNHLKSALRDIPTCRSIK